MTPLVLTFPDIDPVAFRIGPLQIHWYALMYILGFAVAYLLMRRRLQHEPYRSITTPEPYTREIIEDILTYAILGVLIGGRLGYCLFYNPAHYLANPLDIIKIWDGGMSFHGGAIGVILGLAYLAWRRKRPFLQLADFLVPAVPLGLMFGRIGNFINGELWGREAPEWLPWAMIFPTGGDVPRHPSQLYQALLEGLLLFLILWFFARSKRYRGQASGLFLAGYGLFRFIGEFFREPDAHLGLLAFGMSMGQWLSLPMLVFGIAILGWATSHRIDDSEPESPVDEAGDVAVDNGGDNPDEDTPDERVEDDENGESPTEGHNEKQER